MDKKSPFTTACAAVMWGVSGILPEFLGNTAAFITKGACYTGVFYYGPWVVSNFVKERLENNVKWKILVGSIALDEFTNDFGVCGIAGRVAGQVLGAQARIVGQKYFESVNEDL
jgi:hypothetical protein